MKIVYGEQEYTSLQQIIQFWSNFGKTSIIVAHNTSFERDVTKTLLERHGLRLPNQKLIFADSGRIFNKYFEQTGRGSVAVITKLQDVFVKIFPNGSYNAKGNVKAIIRIMKELVDDEDLMSAIEHGFKYQIFNGEMD